MSEDLAQWILENRPLPESDIEETNSEGAVLASHLQLADALRRIPGAGKLPAGDLFPAPPPAPRFSVMLRQTKLDAATPGTVPVAAGLTTTLAGSASHAALRAAIAAVDRTAGARTQFEPVLRVPAILEAIASPADLGENVAAFAAVDGTVRAGATAKLGFDYHWLREIAAGALAGELGLQIDGALQASLELSLAGSFLACVTLDEARWLRLRVFRRTESNVDFAWQLAVQAQAATPLPEKPEPLALAILGVHEGQWLDSLSKLRGLEERFGAEAKRLLELWKGLETKTAHAIWNAAGSSEALAKLRDWVHAVAALRDQDAFKAALAAALETVPGFASSPAGLWLEAAAGGLLDAATSSRAFERLVAAAASADAILSESALAETLGRLKAYAEERLSLDRVRQALETVASFQSLDEWVKQRLEASLGAIGGAGDLGRAVQRVETVVNLARAIYAKAIAALEQKYSAELSYRYQSMEAGAALLDCSFNFTPEGLAAYRQAFGGDFRFLGADGPDAADVRMHCAALTHSLSRQSRIELHLPFFDREQWTGRWEALAKVEVTAGPDGRILAYTTESASRLEKQGRSESRLALAGGFLAGQEAHFTLGYTDERKLDRSRAPVLLAGVVGAYGFDESVAAWLAAAPGKDVEAALTLSVPGSLVAEWFRAPLEREAEFHPVFSAVSAAVQAALRRWLPYVYFVDLGRYGDLGAAFPLLVYQTMRPFVGACRGEFTYDVMSPETPQAALASTARPLAAELARIHPALAAAGKRDVARFYAPDQARSILSSVARRPVLLNCLLRGDAFFVDNLVELGTRGRKLAALAPRDPRRAVKELARFSSDFVAAFHRRLRRLYGGENFVAFGPLLLAEATAALASARTETGGIAATLRLRSGAAERTFVNQAFRP
jgi:hypothetical protein